MIEDTMSRAEIARLVGFGVQTLRDWVRYDGADVENLCDAARSGLSPKFGHQSVGVANGPLEPAIGAGAIDCYQKSFLHSLHVGKSALLRLA
ncbi:MAG: hypothetical protein OXQ84_17530 [bacterium]|nr:hypothetical protein [bacterium]